MKPRYQIVISLSEDDNNKLQQLRDDGYQIVDIFRLGITEEEEEVRRLGKRKDKPAQDKLF